MKRSFERSRHRLASRAGDQLTQEMAQVIRFTCIFLLLLLFLFVRKDRFDDLSIVDRPGKGKSWLQVSKQVHSTRGSGDARDRVSNRFLARWNLRCATRYLALDRRVPSIFVTFFTLLYLEPVIRLSFFQFVFTQFRRST